MHPIAQRISRFTDKKFVRYGIPFLIMMVAGSFGLKEFAQIRYQFSRKKLINPEDMKKHGIAMKSSDEVTLDTEYEKIKNLDIDEWENKRGPRPWEEGSQAN